MKSIISFLSWLFEDPVVKDVSAITVRRLVCCIWGIFLLLSLIAIPFSLLCQEFFTPKIALHFFNRVFFGIYFPVFLSFVIFWSHGKGAVATNFRINNEIAYAIVFVTLLCNIVIFCILLTCLFGHYPYGDSPPIPEMKAGLSFDLWVLNIIQMLVLFATVPLSRLLGVNSPIQVGFFKKTDATKEIDAGE